MSRLCKTSVTVLSRLKIHGPFTALSLVAFNFGDFINTLAEFVYVRDGNGGRNLKPLQLEVFVPSAGPAKRCVNRMVKN